MKDTAKSEKQNNFIDAYIRHMGHISNACEEVGISRTTFYNWLEEDEFKEKFDQAVEHHNDNVWARIYHRAVVDKNDKMLMFWADRQMKHRGFVQRQEVDNRHSGSLVDALAQAWDDEHSTGENQGDNQE